MKYLNCLVGVCLLPVALTAPTVSLTCGTKVIGSTANEVDTFNGIPYAQPPTGNLRLKPPQPSVTNKSLTIQATGIPNGCPQFSPSSLTLPTRRRGLDRRQTTANGTFGEDCLNLNVQRPSTAKAGSNLPVAFWIYGGAYSTGSTQGFDGTQLINTSVSLDQDIIFVAANYRVNGFGFLGGKEILADGSSNLGLLDQRLALQWVADNIAAFGGDPTKVTIYGESAGAMSVFNQLVLYNGNNYYKGKPLFRGAIMDSGTIIPTDPIDTPKAQQVYDTVVAKAGCASSSDTLACLRAASYETFYAAVTSIPDIASYGGVALSYQPRPDGVSITLSPEVLVQQGKFAKVPLIIADQEDEGTVFSLAPTNLTTTADVVWYLNTFLFQTTTVAKIQQLVDTYPDEPAAGSPFGTGLSNVIYPEYKRLAAIIGDTLFTLTRRYFLSQVKAKFPSVKTYSCLNTYGFGTPVVGTNHASDLVQIFGSPVSAVSKTIQSYYISFFNKLDPNGVAGLPNWPLWSQGSAMLNFTADGGSSPLTDTFRNASYAVLSTNLNAGSYHQ